MRRPFLIITFLTLLVPFSAAAHPGMTDRYDGHKCFKKCENWGILYAEYHLHDKDRKPVRIAKKKKQVQQEEAGEGTGLIEPTAPPQAASAPAEVVRQVIVVREQGAAGIDPLILVLLVLLFLWLILRMSRRKEEPEIRR